MVFDGFYNPGKKRPRRVSRQNSDSRNLKNDIKYINWPSFHPPLILKTTKVQMPSTTVSIIAETTTGQIEQWLPRPPPIPFQRKLNIPNKDKRITSTSFPLPTSSQTFPRQTQRNKSFPKILKNFQIPSIKHSRIQENDLSRLLGPFTTTLKKPDREIESTSAFNLPFTPKTNPTLPSTFHAIRIPKRVSSTSKQNREIKSLSNLFESETTLSFSSKITLQISTLSNIKQEYLNQTTRQIARKSSHPAIFSTRTVILTTLNEKENHEENTRKEDIATTQSKKQTISSVLALSSTQTASVEKETSSFQTPKNVAATQYMGPITTTTPFHQTTLLETDSNPPRLSTIKTMTNGNLSDQTQVEEHLNSININCDQLSKTKTKTRQNKVLNNTNRSLSYHTTTLSVKVKFPKGDWTVSDNRASAVGIGSLGIVVIIAIIGGVICLDATTLFRDAKRIRKKFYRIFRPMKVNNKSTNASRKMPKWAHFVTTREA